MTIIQKHEIKNPGQALAYITDCTLATVTVYADYKDKIKDNKMNVKENGIYELPPTTIGLVLPSQYKCVGYYFEALEPSCADMITGFDLTPTGFVSDSLINKSFNPQNKPVEAPKYYNIAYKRYEGSTWATTIEMFSSIEEFHGNFFGDKPFKCILLKD